MVSEGPFALLGLPATASPEEVKAAYRARARMVHPDAGGDPEAFRALREAADLAVRYARGDVPNPYLPSPDHTLYVAAYDRHAHAPAPPPNVWSSRGVWFWALPVAGVIFMVAGAAGPYFLPVWLGSTAVFAFMVWLLRRR